MEAQVGLSIGRYQRAVGDIRALEIAAEIGCDSVDVNLNAFSKEDPNSPYALPQDDLVAYFDKMRARAKELGLVISQTHGRMRGYSFDSEQDRQLLEDARLDMIATAALGAPYCVIHSITNIHAGFDRTPEDMRRENIAMYRDVLPYAKENGVVVALETFGDATDKNGRNGCDFFGQPDELLNTYNALRISPDDAKYFCFCMDTGHTNKAARFGNPKPGELIRRLGSDIRILHLNDNDGILDQHKIPYTGTIDWDDVLRALQEIGYCGAYNMELHLDAFGKGIDMMKETGAFAVKVLREALKKI